jgi:hypothetical protein
MRKYEKYIYCNLGYYGNDNKPHSLLMTHMSNESNHTCDHCNKPIKGNVYHFDEYKDYYNDGSKKWTFDYKCMPFVVGVGLK